MPHRHKHTTKLYYPDTHMQAQIFSKQELIGTADLQPGDISMGHICGIFTPNDYYYQHLQNWVWAFWDAALPDNKAWQKVQLSVKTDSPALTFAAEIVTIDDMFDLPDEPLQIDIAGLDTELLIQLFPEDLG